MSVIRTRQVPLVLVLVGCFLMASGVFALAAEPGNPNAGCDESHHSDTGHGANQSGAYDSTCDGSPSMNGNGGGGAAGRPCAGCVGNADDKNPPGQYPDGSDPNNGYECDGNSGIGRTNPAHTGCTTTASTPTPPPPATPTPPGKATTPPPTTTPPTTPPSFPPGPPSFPPGPPSVPPGLVTTPTPPPGVVTPPPTTPATFPPFVPPGPPSTPPGRTDRPEVPPRVLPTTLTANPDNPGTPQERPAQTGPAVAAAQPAPPATLPFTGGGDHALALLVAGMLLAGGGSLMLVTGRQTA